MGADSGGAAGFRGRLDAVLRQRDPAALRAFLVAEGQWQPDATTDAEAAMWMMIAASRALVGMHGEAERWLMSHGHEMEAQAILGKPSGAGAGAGAQRSGGGKGATHPGGGQHRSRQNRGGERGQGSGKEQGQPRKR